MFPNYKKLKPNWINYLIKIKDGWTSHGDVYGTYDAVMCNLCGKQLKLGKEQNGEAFRYCPRCLTKKNKILINK